jgi:hypothetical protein
LGTTPRRAVHRHLENLAFGEVKHGVQGMISAPNVFGRHLLLLSVLCLFIAKSTEAETVAANCAHVQILSEQLTSREAEAYCRYVIDERQKVENFWGTTWQGTIRIDVDRSHKISKALIHALQGNRGFMEMPLRRVRDNTGALLHEIVHIYAPSENRFLAEGLAVYLHTKLAGNPAFPNFRESLARGAARSLSKVQSLETLNGVRTPRPLSTVIDEETAYTLAGSFVGFLIERYGLASFQSLYETPDYEKTYAKPLDALEKEWRATLEGK